MKLDVHCACKPAAESLGTVYWTNVSNLQPVFKYLIISKKIALQYTVPRVFAFSTVRQKKIDAKCGDGGTIISFSFLVFKLPHHHFHTGMQVSI